MDVLQRSKTVSNYVEYELKLKAFMQNGTCLYDFIKSGTFASDNDVIEDVLVNDMSETNRIMSDPEEWFKILKKIYNNYAYINLKIMFDDSFEDGYKLCWRVLKKNENLSSFDGIVDVARNTNEAWFGSEGYRFDIVGDIYNFHTWVEHKALAHLDDKDMWKDHIKWFKEKIKEYEYEVNKEKGYKNDNNE